MRPPTPSTWRGDYLKVTSLMVGADPRIGRATISERLGVPEDDLDWFLGPNWLDRAASAQTKRGPDASNV